MLELIELRFSGIGRFVDEQIINFTTLNDFIQIDGQNNNTGGSSGSGKTTIFNALDYLLGLNDTPATILQSRFTKEPITVVGQFLWNGEAISISRSKGKFKIEGKSFGTSVSEEKLDAILGMSRDLFRKITHKRQKEVGFFLDFTPKEMYGFLMDCMGLKSFHGKIVIVDERIKKLTEEKSKLESEILANKTGLQATQDAIMSLGIAPQKEVTKENVLELKERYERSTIRFKDVQAECKNRLQELDKERPNQNVLPRDERVREDLERRRKEIESQISAYLSEDRERQQKIKDTIHQRTVERSEIIAKINSGERAKAEATKIAAEIKQIRDSKCPTCEQSWVHDSVKIAEKSKIDALVKLKETISIAQQASIRKIEIDKEIEGLQPQLLAIINPKLPDLNEQLSEISGLILEDKRRSQELYEQQNAATKKLFDNFSTKVDELNRINSIEIEQARGQAYVDSRAFDIAVDKMKSYEDARIRYENSFAFLRSKEETFSKKIEDLQKKLNSIDEEIPKAEELKKAIKTFLSYSFDEALESIGDSATKIIRCIPNMYNATIQFEGTKVTGEGKVKEEVTAVIGMDGETGIPIKSLSGGERSAADLAIDLAVIDFIESKSGKGMNIFILDEPFNGLGTVEIEMALEVLKNSNTNKKIIIVDHNPEIKQMVQSRLIVVRDGTTSKVA